MQNSRTQSFFDACRKTGFPALAGLMLAVLLAACGPASAQSTSSIFGPNVTVIPSIATEAEIETALTNLSNEAEFSTNRYAVLFQPGTYTVQAPIGYYESISGLGQKPGDVTINGFITPNFGSSSNSSEVLVTFWRSMENLTFNVATSTAQSAPANTLQWGVSQGTALRRLQINGSLELTDTGCGYSSGGFAADLQVTGNINSCSQQQWYTRNSSIGSWSGGNWNMVFSGVTGAPAADFPSNSYTVLSTTPVVREKPFLYADSGGNYFVFVPSLLADSSGTSWSSANPGPGAALAISTFFIATPSSTLTQINNALAAGQNLILTPGIYQYKGAINVTNADTVVLGLGYATVVPQNGTAAITVADVDGVQIAGLIIDAGPVNSPVLLQMGVAGTNTGVSHAADPSSLHDVFFRIGGATAGTATESLEVDSDNVILDNDWIWRADHGADASWNGNTAANGLVVNGDNVTALGLAVEHYQQNEVVWNGQGGETIFYQSELPYDVPSQNAYMQNGIDGYPSYYVAPSVTTHKAYGMGVYSYFDQGVDIVETSAISVPNAAGVSITDAVTVFLAGSGGILYTVNNAGAPVVGSFSESYVASYPCAANCPSAPTNLSATASSQTQINLTWTASPTAAAQYIVFRGASSGFTPSAANRITTTPVSGTSFNDTGLTASTPYYYLVEATVSNEASPASNQASATTAALVPDFLLGVSPSSLTLSAGSSGSETVTLTPADGFSTTQTVSYSCSGLPSSASCTFGTSSVVSGNIVTTLTVNTTTSKAALHTGSAPWLPGSALAAALCWLGWKKRRGRQWMLLLAVSGIELGLFAGCGGSSAPAPTSTTVTVTAISGTLKHTATFLLTID
jgi:hypothetical protein